MASVFDTMIGKLRSAKTTASAIAAAIVSSAAKTTPVDADTVPIVDSADSSKLKEVTWANVKTTLKAYFDTLYGGASNVLLKANNLSDLANTTTARSNLGLSGMATVADAPSDGNNYGRKNGAWDKVDQAEVAAAVHAASAKSTPATNDEFGFADSADSFALKKITFGEVYLAVKGAFDMVYQATGLSLLKANNLSDLNNTATARSSLGLGTAATGTAQSVTVSAPLATSQSFSVIGSAAPTLSISAATTMAAGSLSSSDKTKLDGLGTASTGTAQSVTVSSPLATSQAFSVIGAAAPTLSITTQAVTVSAPLATSQAMSVVAASAPTLSIAAATTDVPGSMSAADKLKVDNLGTAATGTAQSVTVSSPLATSQAFSVIGSAAPTLSITTQSVTVSAPLATSQAMSVIAASAPTLSISAASGTDPGSMSSSHYTKVTGIEAGADVTDAGNIASSIVGVAAKTPPIDADTIPCIDSASANALSKVTWANVKATLKSYFDGIYAAAGGGAWTTIGTGKYTAEPASTSTITMSDTSDMKVGLPLKYTYGGANYYGMVTVVTANTSITVAGATLVTGGGSNLTALCIGDSTRIQLMTFFVSGEFADAADTDLLGNHMFTKVVWQQPKAYLVAFQGLQGVADTGATEASVGVQINGAQVSTDNTNAGPIMSGTALTWVKNSAVGINTSNYDINYGEELELTTNANGTNKDATNLTVQCVFVFE